jgi:hypothetical protein
MADEKPKLAVPAPAVAMFMTPAQGAALVPPTESVGHVALALTASEVLFALARTRVMPVLGPMTAIPQAMQEYFLTLAMSPTTARNLLNALSEAVRIYEEKFGKIPVDPNVQLQATGAPTKAKP